MGVMAQILNVVYQWVLCRPFNSQIKNPVDGVKTSRYNKQYISNSSLAEAD